jgi:peptidoglycan/xylan/chitin deacetylase (PgdA/CDA1 family)
MKVSSLTTLLLLLHAMIPGCSPADQTPDSGVDVSAADSGSDAGFDAGDDSGCYPGFDAGPPPFSVIFDDWPWDAEGAVTFTIDEGVPEPYLYLAPEIEKFGWRSTFFVYTDQPTAETWGLIANVYKRGHEVSSHTATHMDMTTLTASQLHCELAKAIETLQLKVAWNIPLLTFAYPYEASSELVWSVVRQYHRYARG